MMTPPATPDPQRVTYIIGHKNPDADSICSAIAYAAYKEVKGERGYLAARCGNSNARIDTILSRFHQPLPLYLSDVSPRVRDLMTTNVLSLDDKATCSEALQIFDQNDIRVIPVTGDGGRILGSISLATLGRVFLPRLSDRRQLRLVHTSLANIARTLEGQVMHVVDEHKIEDLYVRLGTMDIASFWGVSIRENILPEQSLILVGDRRDLQRRAVEFGVRAMVITGNLGIDDEILALARERGTSIILSPHDSATTAWVVRTASTVARVVDREFATIDADLRISEVKRKFAGNAPHALFVANEVGNLEGILTKTDLFRPVHTQLVLVDHNEMSQAVNGANEVIISEIIDHHRLGSINTQQPILFINEPVGSTCTIIADLFRREGIQPSPDIAGIMMSGLISDTLHLHGPTTTRKDAILLAWLAEISGVNSKQLAEEIFNSGSVILANPPEKIVRSDYKIYDEQGVRFSVSQVEELGLRNFWAHAKGIAGALQELCSEDKLAFSALLVTDINTQNSVLLVKGDESFISRISYAPIQQTEAFDLPGVVSRKKQLIPYLTSVLREMAADGALPTPSAAAATARS